jgi:hypothetical protein
MKTPSVLLVLVFIIQLSACKKEVISNSTGDLTLAQNLSAKNLLIKKGCPVIEPSNFVSQITNPYFPLVPEKVFHYLNRMIDGEDTSYEHIEVSVTTDTKIIEGVHCRVVHDVVKVEGEITEDTYDWYAQDKSGNVWYFGEHSKSWKDKNGWTTEGSWKAGTHNACTGIIMWADPQAHAGETYYQEFLQGIAEDQAQVINTNSTVSVPYGTFTNCVKTKEFTGLEPGVVEYKYYAAGVGMLKTVMTQGGNELEVLTSVTN